MKYVINGKFLSQRMTGVQRLQIEMIQALDKIVEKDDDIVLLVPPNAKKLQLDHIKVVQYGKKTGIIWEQVSLLWYQLKNHAIGVNLGNVAPILKPGIVCVCDMNAKVNPQFYSAKYRIWNNLQFFHIFHRAKKVITISEFSKKEIQRIYHCKDSFITVIPCAWQHYNRVNCDNDIMDKAKLKRGEFFFALSSMAPNKNFNWIIENAKKNPDQIYVIAGMQKKDIYGEKGSNQLAQNVKYLGYISDEEAKALMSNCKAFIFPTFYEGFGMPPLEALSAGAKVIVSDIECMHEVFGQGAVYVNPNDSNVNLDEQLQKVTQDRRVVLARYSWDKSARMLYQILYPERA